MPSWDFGEKQKIGHIIRLTTEKSNLVLHELTPKTAQTSCYSTFHRKINIKI